MPQLVLFFAFLFNGILIRKMIRSGSGILSIFFLIQFAIQPFLLSIYLLFPDSEPIDLLGLNSLPITPSQNAFALAGAYMVPVLIFFLIGSIRARSPQRTKMQNIFALSLHDRNVFLGLIGTFFICNVFGIFTRYVYIPFFGSLLQYLYNGTILLSAFIGYYWRYRVGLLHLFFLVLFPSILLGIAWGGRGYFMFTLGFFLLGNCIYLYNKRHYAKLLFTCSFVIVLLIFAGAIEQIRYAVRELNDATLFEQLSLFAQILFQHDQSFGDLLIGLKRIIPWTNVAAPLLVPEFYEYRGYSDFIDDFLFTNQSTLFVTDNGLDIIEQTIESGFNYGAAKYLGFQIGVGITVPLPIIADGWIRGGVYGVVLYCIIVYVILEVIESVARHVLVSRPHFLFFIAIMLSQVIYRSYESSFSYQIRTYLLTAIFWIALIHMIPRRKLEA